MYSFEDPYRFDLSVTADWGLLGLMIVILTANKQANKLTVS